MNTEFRGITATAKVLVVDDNALSRTKFTKALSALGFGSEAASGGQQALDRLAQGGIDLVLLDILMPVTDGFDVLRQMRQDSTLREVPVLVISGLDATEDIAQALELGAVDFLPKDVAPAIFKARINGTLDKKRLRDVELAYLADVALLTSSARQMRTGSVDPSNLAIDPVRARQDGLGTLARVFAELAAAVHRREQQARLRINLLQGCLLLMVMGICWGVVPALSKIMVAPGALQPIGLAAWVALCSLVVVSLVMLGQGRRPHFSWARMRFGLIAGLFAGVLPQATLFLVAAHVPGVVLSVTLALESLIVFAIAATLRLETPNLTRLCGLLLGLLAVVVIALTGDEASGLGAPLWGIVAVIVPLSYAIQNILVAAFPEEPQTTPIDFMFFLMLGSTLWGWAGAVASGAVLDPTTADRATLILIGVIGLMSAISQGSYVAMIRKMGPVFASQYAYVVTILGVGWAVLLLNERLTIWVWVALGCVLLGMFLVRPKERAVSFAEILGSDDTDPIQRR